jgi:hypothetical protein
MARSCKAHLGCSVGLDKYGSAAQLKEFEAWLQCYGKSTKATDKVGLSVSVIPHFQQGGRAVWYFGDQHTRPVQNPPGDSGAHTAVLLRLTRHLAEGPAVANSTLPSTSPSLIASSSAASSSASFAPSSSTSSYEAAVVRQEGLRASSGLWKEKLRDECGKPYLLSLCKDIDAGMFPPSVACSDACVS